jgi:hypothetical protein
MNDQDRIAPDCSGYVGVDCAHGKAVTVTPYVPPVPRAPDAGKERADARRS